MRRQRLRASGDADTEHFSTESDVQCECGTIFEPARRDCLLEDGGPSWDTYSTCCPACGDEVTFDLVDERSQIW